MQWLSFADFLSRVGARHRLRNGQPVWLDGLKAVRAGSWYEGETDAWAPLMASVNPIREVVSCMISGLRCAPHLVHNPNADVVQVAFQEVAKVTSKCAIVFAEPPAGKHHKRAATPRPTVCYPAT